MPVPTTTPNPTPTVHDGPSAGLPAHLDPMALLGQWGPDADRAEPVDAAGALAHCHALARSRYENFSVLTGLVPPDLRDDFASVYAFCRWADDLADETHRLGSPGDPGTADPEAARARSTELLAWWRRELDRCFGGEASHPVFVSLRRTIETRRLRPEPFHDLITAFEQDQRTTRYRTWPELIAYCSKSADPVGRIVLTLAGHRPPDEDPGNATIYDLSDRICTALQLTNFWQDTRSDLLERDRVYMPIDETGLDADTLRDFAHRGDDPEARVRFILALRPLVERTSELFDSARDLPRRLDPRIAPVVALFASGGRRTLRKVEGAGCTSLWKRPKLTKPEKAALLARAWAASRLATRTKGGPS